MYTIVSLDGHEAVPASGSPLCTSVYCLGVGMCPSHGDAGSWPLGVSCCRVSSAPVCGHCPPGVVELVAGEAQLLCLSHRTWPSACPGGSAPGCLSGLRVAREGQEWGWGKGAGQDSGQRSPMVSGPRESRDDVRSRGPQCWCRCVGREHALWLSGSSSACIPVWKSGFQEGTCSHP